MKLKLILTAGIILLAAGFSGCAQKADPNRPLEKVRNEVLTMSVKDLEANALAYAEELKRQKAEIDKVKDKMKDMPVDQIFANDFLTNKVKKIGHRAGALFDRYVIYREELQKRGADISRIELG